MFVTFIIQVIDEADRILTEEKHDWYRLLEDALYHPGSFAFSVEGTQGMSRFHLQAGHRRACSTIAHQYDVSHDMTVQKVTTAFLYSS